MTNLKLNVINATSLGILIEIVEHLTIELMRKPIMLNKRKKEIILYYWHAMTIMEDKKIHGTLTLVLATTCAEIKACLCN